MAPINPSGDGSVYKDHRKNKNLWIVEFKVAPQGIKKRHRKRFKLRKDAEAYRRAYITARDEGISLQDGNMLASDLFDEWIEYGKKSSSWKDKDASDQQDDVRRFLKPRFGHKKIKEITVADVENWSLDLLHGKVEVSVKLGKKTITRKREYAPKTVKNKINQLSAALDLAVRRRWLNYNVAQDAEKPKVDNRLKFKPLTLEYLQEFRAATERHAFGTMWWLMSATGMRWGEVSALQWDNVYGFKEDEPLRIDCLVELTRKDGKWHIDTPKTQSGIRRYPITTKILDKLEDHKGVQEAIRELNEEFLGWGDAETTNGKVKDLNLMFTTDDGNPIHNSVSLKAMRKCLRDSGMDATMKHKDLRSAVGTILISLGHTPQEASKFLGHSDESITKGHYIHEDGWNNRKLDMIDSLTE